MKGWSLFKCGTMQSTWQQCSSASRARDPVHPHHTTLTLPPAAEGQPATLWLVCLPPPWQGLWTAAARRAAHGAVNHKLGGKEKRTLQGSAFVFGYNLEKEWKASGLAYLRQPLFYFDILLWWNWEICLKVKIIRAQQSSAMFLLHKCINIIKGQKIICIFK